jgi:hypothetical protein
MRRNRVECKMCSETSKRAKGTLELFQTCPNTVSNIKPNLIIPHQTHDAGFKLLVLAWRWPCWWGVVRAVCASTAVVVVVLGHVISALLSTAIVRWLWSCGWWRIPALLAGSSIVLFLLWCTILWRRRLVVVVVCLLATYAGHPARSIDGLCAIATAATRGSVNAH